VSALSGIKLEIIRLIFKLNRKLQLKMPNHHAQMKPSQLIIIGFISN